MATIKDILVYGSLAADSRFVIVRLHFLADEVHDKNDKEVHTYTDCDLYWLYGGNRYFVSITCDEKSCIVYYVKSNVAEGRTFYVKTNSSQLTIENVDCIVHHLQLWIDEHPCLLVQCDGIIEVEYDGKCDSMKNAV